MATTAAATATATAKTTTKETNVPAAEDTYTLNRVSVGIRQRDSARHYIENFLVIQPRFLSYVHLGSWQTDTDGVRRL